MKSIKEIINSDENYSFDLYNGKWEVYKLKEGSYINWFVLRNGKPCTFLTNKLSFLNGNYNEDNLKAIICDYFYYESNYKDIENKDLYSEVANSILSQNTVQAIEGNGYVPPIIFLLDLINLLEISFPTGRVKEIAKSTSIDKIIVEGTYDGYELNYNIMIMPVSNKVARLDMRICL